MNLQTELEELSKNPHLIKIYANPRCRNKCYGSGYQNWVVGKDPITNEYITEKRICHCVIKALKKDMDKENG